jgi:transposase
MREKINEKTFDGQSIYVGIDVHKKSWKVSVMTKDLDYKTFSAVPQAEKLNSYLREHFPGAEYYTAYEAGFSGFWLHRELTNLGIKSIVVNPADVPTTDKERRQKEDQRDSRKIAQTLRSGHLQGIYVPSEKIQQDRTLLRTRDALVKDLSRNKNRIKSLLYFEGIPYPERFYSDRTHWSLKFIEWLESIATAKAALAAYLDMVKHQRALLLRVTRQIRMLSQTLDYKKMVDLLVEVPGIGVLTAMKLLTELGDISRFSDFNRLRCYAGLVPSTASSGEKLKNTGITPRTNSRLRVALIESAWVAIRNDPAMLAAYQKLSRRMPGNRAIIRIAKKLLSRIAFVLRTQSKYEKGVIK